MRGPRAGGERGVLIRTLRSRGRATIAAASIALLTAGCTAGPGDAPERAAEPADSAGAAGEPEPVAITGRVLDGETDDPVEDAYVVVLRAGVTVAEWEEASGPASEALMEGATITDENGAYAVRDLPRGRAYTLIVAAEGFEPAVFDRGLEIRPDDPPIVRPEAVRLDRRPR